MSEHLLKPRIGVQEVAPIAERLALLYRRVRLLEREKRAAEPPSDTFVTYSIEELIEMDLPTRLDSVKDAISGLDYAAWCIGEVLMAMGGLDLMHLTFEVFEDLFEDREGGGPGSWLDHRWDGVSDSTGAIWAS